MSSYLIKRLKSVWEGANKRVAHRKDLLEPVAISMGLTSVSQFLSQIEIESKVLKLESKEQPLLNSSASKHPIFQAYLLDESKKGFRVKLLLAEEQKVLPTINEVVAIKLSDDSIKVGYLRWIRENAEGYVELGIEHLSSMAEPVQLKMKNLVSQNYETEQNDQLKILDSFVYPGSKTEHYKPIIFTHSFIERFTNQNIQNIQLIHKTGTIDITLTEKVGEILGYSLFLFEKRDLKNLNHKMTQSEKAAQFDSMWKEI